MKFWLFAGAALIAAAALTPAALAQSEGPRPSSENHWPGMTQPTAEQLAAIPATATQAAAPHYEWREGYENGGRWVGHWVLVQ